MKQNVFALLIFLMLPIRVLAADGDTFTASTVESVTVTYTVISESAKTCKVGRGYIKNQGTVYAVDESVSGSVTIPSQVNGYSVVAVADHAFYNRSNIESISLPSSILEIGGSAFMGCSSLPSIVLPDNVSFIGDRAFCNCSLLSSVNIPEGVSRLEELSFRGCSKLDNLSLPSTISFIGEQAFYECSSLTSIIIPDNAIIGKDGIVNLSFSGCSSLKTIVFGEGVRIYNKAFGSLQSLVSVTVGNSISTSSEAFSGITYSNATLYVPAGKKDYYMERDPWKTAFPHIEEITDQILQEYTDAQGVKYTLNNDGNTYSVSGHTDACSGDIVILETVNGLKVTSIGYFPFLDCSGLTSITIPTSVTSIGEEAFMRCSGLTSVNIPNSVTYIGSGAFSGCSNLASITIPNSVTEIGDGVLAGCSRLISIQVESGNSVYDSRGDCHAIIETQSNKLIAGCVNTIIPDGVTSIGKYVFSGFSELTSIVIPNSVTSIGDGAFASTGLTSVSIPDGVTTLGFSAFRDCSSLTSIVIPNSVTSIGEYAFEGCSNLTSITIPNSVTFIDFGAFASTGLTSITIPGSVQNIPEDAFANSCLTSVTIDEGVKSIGAYAFGRCENLSKVILPSTITSIGERAFLTDSGDPYIISHILHPFEISDDVFGVYDWSNHYVNPSPATLYVPVGTKSEYEVLSGWNKFATIEEGEFCETSIDGLYYKYNTFLSTATLVHNDTYRSNITSVEIPAKINIDEVIYDVTTIGYRAFYGCGSLTSIKIPNSVTFIGQEAISQCGGLSFIEVEDGNTKYDSRYNCNALIETETNTLIAGCKNSVIPNGVTSIGDGAFFCCSGPTSIIIPGSVISIGKNAFRSCNGLESVVISEGVKTIGESAFKTCPNLSRVELPSTITSIDEGAFVTDSRGPHIVSHITEPFAIADNVFGITDHWLTPSTDPSPATLYIPAGTKSEYEALSGWNKFAQIVEGELLETTLDGLYFLYDTGTGTATVVHNDSYEGNLTNVVIPATITVDEVLYHVTSIGDNAFWGCNSIKSVVIPEGITTIGECAFQWIVNLPKIVIPSTVISIGEGAFVNDGLHIISHIQEPFGVGDNVFGVSHSWPCPITDSSFATLYVPIGTKSKYEALSGWNKFAIIEEGDLLDIIIDDLHYECKTASKTATVVRDDNYGNLKDIDIPATITVDAVQYDVTSIGDYAFYLFTDLSSVTIPNSVTSIGYRAFRNDVGLNSITIPNSVTSIGEEAFYNCWFSSIIIPNSVTSIGDKAFDACSFLSTVAVESSIPVSINENVFSNSSRLYVPRGSKEAYLSATGWKDFGTIKEYPDGDVNQDGEIDVIDVVDIARFVVGTPSTAFEEFLADLDGSGAVNVADAIVLVNEIAGDTNFARTRAASSTNLSDNVLSLTGDGSALSLQMDGDGRFAAFQFDLWLPSDMDVMKLTLNDMRRQGHQLLYNKVSDSHYRVVALSTSANAFNGVSGELLGITLDNFGNDGVYLDNIHFVTTGGLDVPFDSVKWGYTTSILRPEVTNRDGQSVYNLNGQRLNSPRKGVNIVGGKKVVIK